MIPLFKVFMSNLAGQSVVKTLDSGMITQGPKVEEYEAALKEWFGHDNLLTVNSGTSALQLAVELAGVGAGDYVISTPMTCSATNTAILARQAKIIWADVDPVTGNMTAATLQAALESAVGLNPKAVMMVHWGGRPCDIHGINMIAKKYGLKTIEDAAHAIGAIYDSQLIGQFSDFTCFSTQAIKHLTTVDGGILMCRDREDVKQARLLRWFGIDRDGPKTSFRCELDLVRPGYKYHMNDVNASVGLANLKALHDVLGLHRENAEYYSTVFIDSKLFETAHWTPATIYTMSSSWLYTLVFPTTRIRDEYEAFMQDSGVQTSQVHAPNHKHTFTKDFGPKYLPGVEKFSTTQTNIPVGWWITPEDREKIADLTLQFEAKYV